MGGGRVRERDGVGGRRSWRVRVKVRFQGQARLSENRCLACQGEGSVLHCWVLFRVGSALGVELGCVEG